MHKARRPAQVPHHVAHKGQASQDANKPPARSLTNQAVVLRFVEGDPSPDCTLRGLRMLVALEVATNYAQAAGLRELRIQPINEALSALCEDVYGFALVKPHREASYYVKAI